MSEPTPIDVVDEQLEADLSLGIALAAASSASAASTSSTPKLTYTMTCRHCVAKKKFDEFLGKLDTKCMSCDADFRFSAFHTETKGVFRSKLLFTDAAHLDKDRFRSRLADMIAVLGASEGKRVWNLFCPVHVKTSASCDCAERHLASAQLRQSKSLSGGSRKAAAGRSDKVANAKKVKVAASAKEPVPQQAAVAELALPAWTDDDELYLEPNEFPEIYTFIQPTQDTPAPDCNVTAQEVPDAVPSDVAVGFDDCLDLLYLEFME